MSVPDWPTTYGYNMFLFPLDKWIGGIFYEHSHRLLASAVGFLTTVLAIWLHGKPARPFVRFLGLLICAGGISLFFKADVSTKFACYTCVAGVVVFFIGFFFPKNPPQPSWLCWLGIAVFLLVILQGVLGGLRVRWNMDSLGVPHGAVAQIFLVLTTAIALFTSRWWMEAGTQKQISVPRGLCSHVFWLTILIFIQLLIAATMRHQHAGLAIWDFPAAHGKIWPDTSDAAIADYNAHRPAGFIGRPITAFQVDLQMVHRLVAYTIFLGVVVLPFLARKKLGGADWLTKFSWFWAGLLAVQICLGAWTVLSNKAADITTLHVMVGALALLTGAIWWLVARRRTTLTKIG
jgi:cytochrome c oxidase assembly protein subunit 15